MSRARWHRLAAEPSRAGVLVDYDGTLAPIVDDPAAAVPAPAARDALAALVGRVALVGVVSGRPVEFLRKALAIEGITCVGQYGLERLVDGAVVVDARARAYAAVVEEIARAAERELPGVLVERKGTIAVGLHWRTRPAADAEVRQWAARAASRAGLEEYRGRMTVELRPPVPVDKGTVVEELAAGLDVVLFAGDDRGDLAAFTALDRLVASGALGDAVRVAVRSPEEPAELAAHADLEVDGPAGVAALLTDLAGAISSPPR